VKIEFNFGGYKYLTDNTKEVDIDTIFLLTNQNKKYQKSLQKRTKVITPSELINIWKLADIEIVGVTGTNGKTTVTAGIYSMLLDLGYRVGLQGTRGVFANDKIVKNKHMTTPSILETLHNIKKLKDEESINFFVMEVSSHAIEQKRVEGLNFSLKVHTNVTSDHLDYHKSLKNYRKIKSSFFSDDSRKLINKDEIKTIQFNPIGAQTYGIEEMATFKILAYSLENDGLSGVISFHQEKEVFSSNMIGLFNLYNITASIASVKILTNEPLSKICKVVENFGGVSGRMEVISRNPTIIVDFAHTADGMYKVLDTLKDKNLVVVFGAGGNRDREKREKMGLVASKFAKKIYVTSDNPRDENPEDIIKEILKGIRNRGRDEVVAIVDRREAIEKAVKELSNSEILLVLGKGDEDYQEIAGVKYPFDDRKVIKDILEFRS